MDNSLFPPDNPFPALDRPVKIGCSGYSYKHWREVFYPARLAANRWLEYYTHFFPTVELNTTFYNMPGQKTFEAWVRNTPEGFIYSVKAYRLITHMKKLNEPQEPLAKFYERVAALGPKLGPLLYQLPPNWHYNHDRLVEFLKLLPPDKQHTIEIRDPSWLNDRFFSALSDYQVAYCISSLPHYKTPVVRTAPFSYFRFHGSGKMYEYDYSLEELQFWRDEILRLHGDGHPVYVYFDNDPYGWAVKNARQLIGLVNEAGPLA
ncbi:MAG: hypothetical protein JWP00_575 [Chloroflexi bacterium]|jgi:uncharacterized protein YecE (DUF72 family)|nr:hypothetical protein [Chloroflexota bacterium]